MLLKSLNFNWIFFWGFICIGHHGNMSAWKFAHWAVLRLIVSINSPTAVILWLNMKIAPFCLPTIWIVLALFRLYWYSLDTVEVDKFRSLDVIEVCHTLLTKKATETPEMNTNDKINFLGCVAVCVVLYLLTTTVLHCLCVFNNDCLARVEPGSHPSHQMKICFAICQDSLSCW